MINTNQKLIDKIVRASGVQPGSLVLLHFWGEDANIGILHEFSTAVAALGASPLELQECRTSNQKRFAVASAGCYQENYFKIFGQVDTILDIFCYHPVILGAKLPDTQMEIYRNYMKNLFHTLMHAEHFVQIRLPLAANAEESGLDPEDFICRMTAAYDIDYEQIKSDCKKQISVLAQKSQLSLLTGNNCCLHFDLAGRNWVADCGSGDMPCGEIYIAPLENKTFGTIFYPELYAEDWGTFQNLTLTVKDGILTQTDNPDFNDHLAKLSANDRTVCELGIGMNQKVHTLCGYTVLDEKAANTCHIAIGANVMFGGSNSSTVHMDFVNTDFQIK
ncbi:MAG: aminopeptidase [Oscillospiraceae bacterium]|nr:aminopeptidase [Oscillospiraceae bacterium]